MNDTFAKRVAIAIGCLILYVVLRLMFGSVINIILLVSAIAYGIYKNNRF